MSSNLLTHSVFFLSVLFTKVLHNLQVLSLCIFLRTLEHSISLSPECLCDTIHGTFNYAQQRYSKKNVKCLSERQHPSSICLKKLFRENFWLSSYMSDTKKYILLAFGIFSS